MIACKRILNSSIRQFSTGVVCTHLHVTPIVHPTAFVAPSAEIMGHVSLAENSSVFYGCVLRADINSIIVGKNSNIQDGSVIHLASHRGVEIGDNVTVGHKAIIHAATVKDNVLIGMGAIVMDESVIGENSIVAAGSLVPKGKVFPCDSLIMGSPAKRVRELTDGEKAFIVESANKYVKVAKEHMDMLASKQSSVAVDE